MEEAAAVQTEDGRNGLEGPKGKEGRTIICWSVGRGPLICALLSSPLRINRSIWLHESSWTLVLSLW